MCQERRKKGDIMKKITLKNISVVLVLSLFVTVSARCSQSPNDNTTNPSTNSTTGSSSSQTTESSSENKSNGAASTELIVRFGDDGDPFVMHLYDNETASAIARHVGTADWRLPIYNYEGYENWEVMQYYDIPSRYEIPGNPEMVTEEAAGMVYYSEPNRIVLFYGDAEVSGEYTSVGYFDNTEEFRNAVKNNPVLEGWGNKIVQISVQE